MSKYDIFGGKPLSAYYADGVSRRSSTTNATAAFLAAFRNPNGGKEAAIAAFAPIRAYIRSSKDQRVSPQQTELKSVVATLSNAWNKVVYNFFHAKRTKVTKMVGGVEKKFVVEISKKHKGKDLNTVQYFRARHPKLFKLYLQSFKQYLAGSPSEGGVVVKNDPHSVGNKGIVNTQYGIVHYKKIGHYNDQQLDNIIRFLKDAHYDKLANLAHTATTGKLATNRGNDALYGKVGGTRYSVMTLYAMFRKLSKKANKSATENQVLATLSQLFAGVTPFAKTPIRGRDLSVQNKQRIAQEDKDRHAQFKVDLNEVAKDANLQQVAEEVQAQMDQVATNRAGRSASKKNASYQRFLQVVAGIPDNASYEALKQQVKNRNPEDSKFLNGYLLALRRVSGLGKDAFNASTLGDFKGFADGNKNVVSRRNVARRQTLATRGVPRFGGSLSSSRLSSMNSSSLSSRSASSFDDTEFTF